jgi:phosphoribosyl-ATP pyrophosphohydrolase
MVLLHEEGLSHNDIFRELDIRSKKGESCNE